MVEGPEQSPWLESIWREAIIRRCLIVYGNVGDFCSDPATGRYESNINVIADGLMKRTGFGDVVLWDQQSGVQNISLKRWSDLRRRACSLAAARSAEKPKGQAYGDGDDDATQPAPQSPGQDIEDFLAVVQATIADSTSRESVAFLIDWSQYLFGDPRALSKEERAHLLRLSKALRQSQPGFAPELLKQPGSMVILFTENFDRIPPLFYQNRPSVKTIAVPLPSRQERVRFLKSHTALFRVQPRFDSDDARLADYVDLLDGFTLTDAAQLARLSQLGSDELTFEKLVSLYKYGEKISPWEELNKKKLQRIEDKLRERVKGQDKALRKVRQVILRAYTGISGLQHSARQKKPKGTLFFVGPTGVGKTELAKALAQFLFGDENACLRFDMSEYNHEHSDQRLVGAPPGYIGHEQGGQLTNAVRARPFSVLLFDEVEKAHGKILDKFLQILEDGRLTDGKGDTAYFSETVIIFTSNIGADKVEPSWDAATVRSYFLDAVRTHLKENLRRPELLNRIGDNIVVFGFVSEIETLAAIASAKFEAIRTFLAEKYGVQIAFTDANKAFTTIAEKVDRAHGGRGVVNALESTLQDPLAEWLFEQDDLAPGGQIRIVQVGTEFAFDLS